MYWDKIKQEEITELYGWASLQSWKDSLDRSGALSDRQVYIDNLSEQDIEIVDEEFIEKKEIDKIRIAELKQLLAESDFRMTTDYFTSMSEADQTHWTSLRHDWREEIRGLDE